MCTKSLILYLLLFSQAFGQFNQEGISYYLRTDSDIYVYGDAIHWSGVIKNSSTDTIQAITIGSTVGEWLMIDSLGTVYDGFDFIPEVHVDTVDIAPADSIKDEWVTSIGSFLPSGQYFGLLRPWVDWTDWGNNPFPFDSLSIWIIESLDIEQPNKLTPKGFALYRNYPNPFNPTTTIQYDLPRAGHISLTIYDLLGQEVAAAVDRWQEAGTHSVVWDAQDMPSGLYLVRMVSGSFSQVRKVMVLK